jgi:hypothetical protein
MEPVIVAEILEKSGRVKERVRLVRFPMTIGRGYGNDLILDDDFVAATQARIELDEQGNAVIVDLDSDNGTFELPALRKITRLSIGADALVRMGHTLLRLRTPDYVVAAARHDSLGVDRWSRWVSSGKGATLAVLIMTALLFLDAYQTSMQPIKTGRLLLDVLPVLVAIPIWAGLWALASRGFAHHAAYLAHLTIASLGVTAFFLLDTAAEYYAFAFSADISADLIFHTAGGMVAAAMLYGHLRFATLLTPRVVATSSILIAVALVALTNFTTYVQGSEYNDDLPYPGELKPPMFKLSKSRTPQAFAEDSKEVVELLDSGALD